MSVQNGVRQRGSTKGRLRAGSLGMAKIRTIPLAKKEHKTLKTKAETTGTALEK